LIILFFKNDIITEFSQLLPTCDNYTWLRMCHNSAASVAQPAIAL